MKADATRAAVFAGPGRTAGGRRLASCCSVGLICLWLGLELSLDCKPAERFSLKPFYTCLEAIDTGAGLWLSAKPGHRVKADLRLRPLAGLSLGLFFTYAGCWR